jgi:uncharacterized cupin superfamily protein
MASSRAYDVVMVPEAALEHTEHGLLPGGEGWFILNAREAEWRVWHGRGKWPRFEGAGAMFPQLGLGLTVLEPGEPLSMYHWESDQEDFLVLHGEALAIVEGQERPLRKWDFLHCPAGTKHSIVGAGNGSCVVFAVGARERTMHRTAGGQLAPTQDWGGYPVDEVALRNRAGVEQETSDKATANPTFPERVSTSYRNGWLRD